MRLPFYVQELTNGSVMVNARNELRSTIPSHAHHRAVAVSHDGALRSCPPSAACATPIEVAFETLCAGGRSFGPYHFDEELIEPTCMAGLINFGGTLYFSNPAQAKSRTHMTLKKSTDSGEHWAVDTLIWPGPAAYSLVVPLSANSTGGAVGVVYERGFQGAEENMSIAIVATGT